MNVAWPGWRTTAWHAEVKERDIRTWWGGLVDGMRDASGQQYMRNRYYDPATGQFTQPDPIGIAGGLNSYGFAAGDPVSYADPYGLSTEDCCRNDASRRQIREEVSRAQIGASIARGQGGRVSGGADDFLEGTAENRRATRGVDGARTNWRMGPMTLIGVDRDAEPSGRQ